MTDFEDLTVDRRGFILKGAIGAAALSLGGGLARAGGAAVSKGLPTRGGRFTVGMISAGTAETLIPSMANSAPDYARCFQLYNCLFDTGEKINPIEPRLALSAEPNANATVWTFHLRDGVTWHDGKPFTADDVVWTFRKLWADPKGFAYGYLAGLVNFSAVRKSGRLTVKVPLASGCGAFPALLCGQNFYITQNGATPATIASHPIGTGPFKFVSFTPGAQSVFTANRDYWESGKPYVDEVVINSSFSDQTSRVNAFLAGDIDLMPDVPPVVAKNQLTTQRVLVSSLAAKTLGYAMRVDKGPFADNRIREAFKLLVDREAVLAVAGGGFGHVAYDVQGPGCEYYLKDFTRKRDVEKAKSLLKAAGADGKTFNLVTAPVYPGVVECATVLAQQAPAAGVHVKVDTIAASTFFTAAGGNHIRPFGVILNNPPWSCLAQAFQADFTRTAPYKNTWWGYQRGGAKDWKRINQAIAAVEPARAKELWREVQLEQANQGGYLWWGNLPFIDGVASKVRGLKGGAGANFNNWRLLDGWLA